MRICVYGPPGCGKSMTASWLCRELNLNGYEVPFVHEFVKTKAHRKEKIHEMDQFFIFGNQIMLEVAPFINGFKHIITECPVMLCAYYEKTVFRKYIVDIVKEYDNVRKPLNIWLDREGIPYQTKGRWQTEEEAIEMEKDMFNFMKGIYGKSLIKVKTLHKQRLYEIAAKAIRKEEKEKL